MHFGEWEGKTYADLAQRPEWNAFNTVRSAVRPPGGELMLECQMRMVREIERIAREHPNDTVALVSHGDPVRALLAYFLGISIDLITRFEISTASVSVVQVADWGSRIVCVNRTGEIPA